MFGLVEDVRAAMFATLSARPAVLATITGLEGGGPRPVGDQMLLSAQGLTGYLSGGCVEGDVSRHAQACLEDGAPRRLVYGQGSPWPDITLQCGARLEILLERLAVQDRAVAALRDLTLSRRAAVWTSDGRQRRCDPDGAAPAAWDGAFRKNFPPWPRLIVVGGDPTALALAALGVQSGFQTSLVRPKGPLDPPPIAGLTYRRETADLALAAIGVDRWTAVAVCSHEAEVDHQAARTALNAGAGYVGVLGARRRLGERLSRLTMDGVSSLDVARLRAPIGLDLGGKAPFEIAVAVIGEITAARRGRLCTGWGQAPGSDLAQDGREQQLFEALDGNGAAFSLGQQDRALERADDQAC